MSKLFRIPTGGRPVFVICATQFRRPLLEKHAEVLCRAMKLTAQRQPCDFWAWCILPDHFHAVIDVPNGDLSPCIHRLKMCFTRRIELDGYKPPGRIWQPRFWDHVIRDAHDLKSKTDYTHYNPVHHGLVASPFDWRYSSIHQYYDEGYYGDDWGSSAMRWDGDFGEAIL